MHNDISVYKQTEIERKAIEKKTRKIIEGVVLPFLPKPVKVKENKSSKSFFIICSICK